MKKRSIVITGGAGFIGINSARFFLKKNFKVFIFDNFSRKGNYQNIKFIKKEKIKKKNLKVIKIDIINKKKIFFYIKKIKPDIILHLAGQVAVTTSVINPQLDFNSNLLGTFNILEACRNFSKETFLIYSSTNKVYGKVELPILESKYRYNVKGNFKGISESMQLDFYSPYGCSKGAADQYIIDYARIYNLRTVVIRQSCIYGTHQYGIEDQGWVSWFMIGYILKKKVTIFGSGKQVRDLLFVDDLVELYFKLFKNIKRVSGKAFNVGGGIFNTLSLLELDMLLKDKFNLKNNVKFEKTRPGDQKIFISDNTKLKKTLNWKPKTKLKEGLVLLFNWLSHNKIIVKNILEK